VKKDGTRRGPRKKVVSGDVSLPAYISLPNLSSVLHRPLKRLALDARKTFDWWPVQTKRQMAKEGFATIKDVVLRFEEAAKITQHYKRTAVLRDDAANQSAWEASRPFGPVRTTRRPAVIGILGHKDHGKTTLLDRLRGGNLASKEEFGITQETYAFSVDIGVRRETIPKELQQSPTLKHLKSQHLQTSSASPSHSPSSAVASSSSSPSSSSSSSLVSVPFSFLDTPGHVSFQEMRSTVASNSDLLLVVVAADEGVLDQTFESLRLASSLKKPIILVISKMDLPHAEESARRIRQELKELGAKIHGSEDPIVNDKGDMIVLETAGLHLRPTHGEQQSGIDPLRELCDTLVRILPQLPLMADTAAVPRGRVVESFMAAGRGSVVRVILEHGTLKQGQWFVCEGMLEGRVRDIRTIDGGSASVEGSNHAQSDRSVDVGMSVSRSEVTPGIPFELSGFSTSTSGALPNPGSDFLVVSDGETAKQRVEAKRDEARWDEQERKLKEERMNEEEEVGDQDDETDDATAAEPDIIPPEFIPVDLDPRSRVAPHLPDRSVWELSPAPPPQYRRMPLAQLRPKFKYYYLEKHDEFDATAQSDQQATLIQPLPTHIAGSKSNKKFGLQVLLKTQNMGALQMLRSTIEEMNARNEIKGLPSIHLSYAGAGPLFKKDLMTAESEGCWMYCFRVARPANELIRAAKARSIPLFIFRHHQHLLDHMQKHIEASPDIDETGRTITEQEEEEDDEKYDEDESGLDEWDESGIEEKEDVAATSESNRHHAIEADEELEEDEDDEDDGDDLYAHELGDEEDVKRLREFHERRRKHRLKAHKHRRHHDHDQSERKST